MGLRWLLRRLGICPNAYYNYLKNRKAEYRLNKAKLLTIITQTYHERKGIPGYRLMTVLLKNKGISISGPTCHKYMNTELKLFSVTRRHKPGYHKGTAHKVFENLLKQNFAATMPDKIWCTDFAYIPLSNGSMRYNCTILDLYDRSVIASVHGRNITAELGKKTLEAAISQHPWVLKNGVILHSDQGSQYTSKEFTDYCSAHNITQSMSRAGCPYDNAPMERYFNTLKSELIYQHSYSSEDKLFADIDDYVLLWYNSVRPHSFNNGLTPWQKRMACFWGKVLQFCLTRTISLQISWIAVCFNRQQQS